MKLLTSLVLLLPFITLSVLAEEGCEPLLAATSVNQEWNKVVEEFQNRPSDRSEDNEKLIRAIELFMKNVLPKLAEEETGKFVSENGESFMTILGLVGRLKAPVLSPNELAAKIRSLDTQVLAAVKRKDPEISPDLLQEIRLIWPSVANLNQDGPIATERLMFVTRHDGQLTAFYHVSDEIERLQKEALSISRSDGDALSKFVSEIDNLDDTIRFLPASWNRKIQKSYRQNLIDLKRRKLELLSPAKAFVSYVGDENFSSEVLAFKGIVLVKFSADWCGPCKQMAPAFNAFAESKASNEVKFAEADIDKAPTLAGELAVRSIPTLIVFRNGQAVARVQGVKGHGQLAELLSTVLKE